MNDKWHLTIWGVRGSFPTPTAEYLEYGGNTSCLSAECGGELVIFDAGSGLAALGTALATRKSPAATASLYYDTARDPAPDTAPMFPHKSLPHRIHIFLSHLHLDHVMGLFLFQPFHDPDAEIHLYGAAAGGISLSSQLKALVNRPFWPLGLDDFPAQIQIHQLIPGTCFPLGQTAIQVSTMEGNHPGGSLYYRLEEGSRSIVYALDCELEEHILPALTDFSQNASLLVWDASFTSQDLIRGWGHSTWEQGLTLGQAAGVRKVLMTHYSREHTDTILQMQEHLAQEWLARAHTVGEPHPSPQAHTACCFARERMDITL